MLFFAVVNISQIWFLFLPLSLLLHFSLSHHQPLPLILPGLWYLHMFLLIYPPPLPALQVPLSIIPVLLLYPLLPPPHSLWSKLLHSQRMTTTLAISILTLLLLHFIPTLTKTFGLATTPPLLHFMFHNQRTHAQLWPLHLLLAWVGNIQWSINALQRMYTPILLQ